MRSSVLSVVAIFAISPLVSVFAADIADTGLPPDMTAVTTAAPADGALSAAPTLLPTSGSALGEYKSVSCGSNPAFGINTCDQCFDGGSVKVGERLTGIFDNWTNPTSVPLVAYKEEQKSPNIVKFGNTTWAMTPVSEAGIWKYSSDIIWTSGSGSKSSFILSPGQKAKFWDADLNAGYTLEKTDRQNGEMIGLLRFPVVSRSVNLATATESEADTHYECVAYKLSATATPAVSTATPVTPAPAVPVKEMTKTETGPETLLLIAAAFFIAFGLMMTLRKRA